MLLSAIDVEPFSRCCRSFFAGALLTIGAANGCSEEPAGNGNGNAGNLVDASNDGDVAYAEPQEPELKDRKECPTQDPLTPIAYECEDDVCYAVLRLDFHTQELLGWFVLSSSQKLMDEGAARMTAEGAFREANSQIWTNPKIDGPHAGLFLAYSMPADIGAFALIGADTGAIVVGGEVRWGTGPGRLDYFEPTSWRAADDLACGAAVAQPLERFVGNTFCGTRLMASPPRGAQYALETALRTNLAVAMAARGPFLAFATLYQTAGSECDTTHAEWLIVLTQKND